MGRCGGWLKGLALLLVALIASCGGTDSKPGSTGKPFVFSARGRLNLFVQVDLTDPKFLYLTATLLDPQGNPFRNQRVTFEAEFPDAIFTPPNPTQNNLLACLDRSGTGNSTRCTNRGAAITDDNGQAKVTLFAIVSANNAPKNPNRLMRVIAEAPNSLDIAASISVPFTNAGFIFGGTLSIIPPEVTFINPLIQPGKDGPSVTFSAIGGRPPYRWDNQDKSVGRIDVKGTPNIFEQITYTLIGALPPPTSGSGPAAGGTPTDVITLTDSTGATPTDPAPSATANVNVIFAECQLKTDAKEITLNGAKGGETFSIRVSDGVPPFTVTEDFPGTLATGSPQTQCTNPNAPSGNSQDCSLLFTIATPARAVDPDVISIRDSRGCTADVSLTVKLCGNGRIDAAGEECDAPDFGSLKGCGDLQGSKGPKVGGPLRCTAECKLDASLCVDPPDATAP